MSLAVINNQEEYNEIHRYVKYNYLMANSPMLLVWTGMTVNVRYLINNYHSFAKAIDWQVF